MALPIALSLALEARTWRDSATRVAALGLPGTLAWVAIADAFALAGSFDDFWMTAFVHSRHYSGDLFANLIESVSWGRIASLADKPVLVPLGILAACGLLNFRCDGRGAYACSWPPGWLGHTSRSRPPATFGRIMTNSGSHRWPSGLAGAWPGWAGWWAG